MHVKMMYSYVKFKNKIKKKKKESKMMYNITTFI